MAPNEPHRPVRSVEWNALSFLIVYELSSHPIPALGRIRDTWIIPSPDKYFRGIK